MSPPVTSSEPSAPASAQQEGIAVLPCASRTLAIDGAIRACWAMVDRLDGLLQERDMRPDRIDTTEMEIGDPFAEPAEGTMTRAAPQIHRVVEDRSGSPVMYRTVTPSEPSVPASAWQEGITALPCAGRTLAIDGAIRACWAMVDRLEGLLQERDTGPDRIDTTEMEIGDPFAEPAEGTMTRAAPQIHRKITDLRLKSRIVLADNPTQCNPVGRHSAEAIRAELRRPALPSMTRLPVAEGQARRVAQGGE